MRDYKECPRCDGLGTIFEIMFQSSTCHVCQGTGQIKFKPMRDYRKFFTPDVIADHMVTISELEPYMTVLEPQAGNGQIVKAIKRCCPAISVHAIELNSEFIPDLVSCANFVINDDFLKLKAPLTQYSRIIANPPFGNGTDLEKHLTKMINMLKREGILVSVIPQEAVGFFNGLGLCVFESIDNWSKNSDGTTTPICIVKYLKP
jgi:hypothetical protein